MLFSILIPVYNVESYLQKCLDSVLAQCFEDYEVILVDDGSTDESGKLCDRYAEKYPDKIRVFHTENRGLISARVIGKKNAKGEFCVFVDSDDYIEQNLLSTLQEYLQKDEQIDVLLYSFRYVRNGVEAERFPSLNTDGKVWSGNEKKELYEQLIYSNKLTSIWTKAIRTSICRQDPLPYEKYLHKNMAEDLLQSLYPLTAARKICYADQVLYNYCINGASISHDYTLNRMIKNDTRHVYNEIKNYLVKWGMNAAEYQLRLDASFFNSNFYKFVRCYESADSKQARKEIMEFDWNTLLPEIVIDKNPYIDALSMKIWNCLQEKKYRFIRVYFFKKKAYKKLRAFKRSIFK